MDDHHWMRRALALAAEGEAAGEVPVGAVLVRDGQVLGEGFNCPISLCDPSAHAEIITLRQAGQAAANYRLPGATLYVTLEPCSMCVGALIHARIERLVYGATEPKAGAVISQLQLPEAPWLNHRLQVIGGVEAEACKQQLSDFFRRRRAQRKAAQDTETTSV